MTTHGLREIELIGNGTIALWTCLCEATGRVKTGKNPYLNVRASHFEHVRAKRKKEERDQDQQL